MLFGLEADDEWLKTAMDEILMIEKPLKWDKFRNYQKKKKKKKIQRVGDWV